MKLITFTVPCYNSAAYMEKCVDSLLAVGSPAEIEIIIVNDGSSDETGTLADRYAEAWPQTVRVVHQPNGGHGEGVNHGIRKASGLYFKVVDSDDWLDVESGRKMLARMRQELESQAPVDLFIGNYVYEKIHEGTQKPMRYTNVFPENIVIGWQETGLFGPQQYLTMHTLFYRTQVLRDCRLELPKHTFYVDNLFAWVPLPYVKTLCYLNLDLYRYFIGRSDQSVNEVNLIKRIDQQLLVNRMLISWYDSDFIEGLESKLQRYMRNFVRILMAIGITIELLSMDGAAKSDSSLKDNSITKNTEIWELLKERHPEWYYKIRYGSFVALLNIPGEFGRKVNLTGYRIVNRYFKFN